MLLICCFYIFMCIDTERQSSGTHTYTTLLYESTQIVAFYFPYVLVHVYHVVHFSLSRIRSFVHLLASKHLPWIFRCVNYSLFFSQPKRWICIHFLRWIVCQSVSESVKQYYCLTCFYSSITCYCFISFSACWNGYIAFYCLPFWFVSFSASRPSVRFALSLPPSRCLFFLHFYVLCAICSSFFLPFYILPSFRFCRCIRLSSINWTKTYRRTENSERNYYDQMYCVEKVKLYTCSAQ